MGPAPDPWVIMGALATHTRKVQFGPGVTDPYRTHPAVLAQRLATLDQMSKGRVVLGLGSGEAMNLDPYGIDWRQRKVGKIKEFIAVLRGLLDSREPFTFDGDFYQLKNAKLAVRPYKNRKIPIYMAALGPMMQRLAGRVADGWIPVVLPSDQYASYFEPMREAAIKNGRDPAELARVATSVVALNTDGKMSKQQILEYLRPISGALVWEPVLERLGIDWDPPADADSSYLEVNPCDQESLNKYWRLQRWLPAETMSYAVLFGDSDQVLRDCLRFREAGATHLQAYFGSLDPLGSMIQFAHEVMPGLKNAPATPLARTLGTVLGPAIRRGWIRKRFPAPPMKIPDDIDQA